MAKERIHMSYSDTLFKRPKALRPPVLTKGKELPYPPIACIKCAHQVKEMDLFTRNHVGQIICNTCKKVDECIRI